MRLGWGLSPAPDAAQQKCCEPGSTLLCMGLFSRFFVQALPCTPEGTLCRVRDTRSLVLAFTERSDPTPTHHALAAYSEIGRGQLYSIRVPVFPEDKMQVRTRCWILHWVRVVLWPLPVLTFVRTWRATIRSAASQG